MSLIVQKFGGTSVADSGKIVAEVIESVRNEIGPVAAFKLCSVVERLPKTRSGKILRRTMRSIADGEVWTMPATIEDAGALDDVTQALRGLGYTKGEYAGGG